MKKIRLSTVTASWAILLVLSAAFLLMGCLKSGDNPGNASGSQPAAKDFTLNDLAGGTVTLSSLKGKVVVLNFWATWCPPCKAEIPDFIEVFDEYKDENVMFLGISSEEAGVLRSFSGIYGINYPVLIDKSGNVFSEWKVTAIPQTFILNAGGEIVFESLGMVSKSQLVSAIDKALGQ